MRLATVEHSQPCSQGGCDQGATADAADGDAQRNIAPCFEPLPHGRDRGNVHACHRRPHAQAPSDEQEREKINACSQQQADAHEQCARAYHVARTDTIGEVSGDGRQEERQNRQGRKNGGHHGMTDAETCSDRFEENSEGVSDAKNYKRPKKRRDDDNPGARRINCRIRICRHNWLSC
jgi:hypothetical protein